MEKEYDFSKGIKDKFYVPEKDILIDITTRFKNIKENDLDIKKIYINRNEDEDRKISFD